MAFDTPIHINAESIDRVLGAGLPVVLVFWRKDCAPCADLSPALGRLARSYAGQALIAKVDAADQPALVERYRVTQLPTLVALRGGRVLAQAAGAAENPLRVWLEALVGGAPALPALSGPTVTLRDQPQPTPSRPQPQPAAQQPGPAPAAGGAQPVVLTDATFDRIVGQSEQPVLVDFWAPWCGPCRMVAPAVEQLAREFAGKAVVAKLNVDENPRIAQRYGIMSIPALYIFQRGQIVEQLVGAQPAPVLRQALAKRVR